MIVLDPSQEARCDQLFERLRPLDSDARKNELAQLEAGGEDDSVLHLLKKMLALPTDGHERPQQIGEYGVIECLGEGGMGEVYLVDDRALDRALAAKMLPRDLPLGDVLRLRFEREAFVLGRLEHPNIVPIHSYGLTKEGRPYYTMKHVRGQTLKALIDAKKTLRPVLLEIFIKVCDAVAYAHSRDIIHRDLKPDNVMVGAFGEVQVMDWGIARVGPAARPHRSLRRLPHLNDASLTSPGEVWGTPGYISPEQAKGEHIDERTDVFGLGAMLFEILAGRPPFSGEVRKRRISLLRRTGADAQAPQLGWRTPWELRSIVYRAMRGNRDQRYPTVADLRADLVLHRERQYLRGIRYTRYQWLKKWCVRHPRLIAGMLVFVLALIAGRGALDRWKEVADDRLDAARQSSTVSPADLYRLMTSKDGDRDAALRRLVEQAEAWERVLAVKRSDEAIASLATVLEHLRLLGTASKRAEYIEKANEIARRARIPYDSRWERLGAGK